MQPGRSCALHYRYSPQDLARPPDFHAETLYVIGGLYGNLPALETVLDLAANDAKNLIQKQIVNWPADSAGYLSYYQRITRGPAYVIHDANRGTVSLSGAATG